MNPANPPYSSFELRWYRWEQWNEEKLCDEYSHQVLIYKDPQPGVVPFYRLASGDFPGDYLCGGSRTCSVVMKVLSGYDLEPYPLYPTESHQESCVALANRNLRVVDRWDRCESLARKIGLNQFLLGEGPVHWAKELRRAEDWKALKSPSYLVLANHLGQLVRQVREREEAWLNRFVSSLP